MVTGLDTGNLQTNRDISMLWNSIDRVNLEIINIKKDVEMIKKSIAVIGNNI